MTAHVCKFDIVVGMLLLLLSCGARPQLVGLEVAILYDEQSKLNRRILESRFSVEQEYLFSVCV